MPYAPISIVLCEDDDLSCANMFYLLTRDLRTVVSKVVTTPDNLLVTLDDKDLQPDVVLLDAHYHTGLPVDEVIDKIYEKKPQTAVICISEYGRADGDVVKKAIAAGAKGFIDKDDVKFALVTAVLQGVETGFVYSKSIEPHLNNEMAGLERTKHRIRCWRLHPELDPRHVPVVLQSVLYGISAGLIAQEQSSVEGKKKKKDTITRYRNEIYEIIGNGGFYNLDFLETVGDILTPNRRQNSLFYGLEWAFHVVTQPPIYDHDYYDHTERGVKNPFP